MSTPTPGRAFTRVPLPEALASLLTLVFLAVLIRTAWLSDDALITRLVPGGLLLVDNIVSHRALVAPFVAAIMGDPRLDASVLGVGKGVLLARRRSA